MSTETESSPVIKEGTKGPLDAITVVSKSDIGMRREENQDSFGVIELAGFKVFAVADGMGGVKGGAVASGLAIEVLKEQFQTLKELNEEQIVNAIQRANARIFEEALSKPALTGMGTTLVALAFQGTDMFIASVGDSRAYRIREGEISQLTEDHTLVMELLRSGTISAEQAHNHPVSHMLTRSLGPSPDVEIDCWKTSEPPQRGDQYILCSDGLYNLVGDHEISDILLTHPLENGVDILIELANERGGTDNITVIGVELGEGYPSVSIQTKTENGAVRHTDEEVSDTFEHKTVDEEALDRPTAEMVTAGSPDTTLELNLASKKQQGEGKENQTKEGEAKKPRVSFEPELKEKTEENPVIEAGVSLTKFVGGTEEGSPESAAQTVTEEVVAPQSSSDPESVEEPEKPLPFLQGPYGFLAVLAGLIVLVVGAGIIFGRHEETPSEELLSEVQTHRIEVVPPTLKVAGNQVAVNRASVESMNLTAQSELTEGEQGETAPVGTPSSVVTPTDNERALIPEDFTVPSHLRQASLHGLTQDQMSKIERRRSSLLVRVDDLNEKIDSFDKPLSGTIGKNLSGAEARAEKLKKEVDDIKGEIDVATRKLAIWYQRRKQLKEVDAINMAAAISPFSESVKQKHESVKEVTAAYLREADTLLLNEHDQAQRKKVAELIASRKQKMAELAEEIKITIEKEITGADQHVAELALSRDRLEGQLEDARRDITYSKVLMSTDQNAKSKLRQDLIKEREVSLGELEGINQILPSKAIKGKANSQADG